ncbi:MAG TPA: caspase family protein [Candidatus Acidoferrum sp.]|nr:caspase family protein [Candidatus Acidoferrum sp.]
MARRLLNTLLIGALLIAAFVGMSCPARSAGEDRIALVIGNAAYKIGALQNPVNDARAMATVLKQLGFQVILRENASKQQMEQAVSEFGHALTPGSVALFYYAGHGLQLNGHNFLVPVDAEIATEPDVRLQTLDSDAIVDQLVASGSDVNLMILDACRNNPFEQRFRSQGGGLAQIDAPKGTLIAYATAPGHVASDGAGGNGLYTAKLIDAMKTPGIPIEEMFKRVRIAVSQATSDAQTPWEASSLVGDFYFSGPTTVVVNAPVDRDALYWQSVKDSSEPALIQTYLDQFPQGAFVPLAKARIAALRAPTAPAPPAATPGSVSAFDGIWIGTYECGPVPGTQLGPFTNKNRLFAVKQGRLAGVLRWRRKQDAVGTNTYSGTVDGDGRVTIVGLGVYDSGGKNYRIYDSGRIVNGELQASGKEGARSCTLTFHRVPPADVAAGQPTAAALTDIAAADGTWQGLYKCGPVGQKLPGFEATDRVFSVKDGRLAGRVQWKRAADGVSGEDLFSGFVGSDGQVLIVGSGLDDKGNYPIYHSGTLANGHLTASGKQGPRACTLDYLRVPGP